MSQLITTSDIEIITGLNNDTLASLIPYAQAQARAALGFLEEETKTEYFYIEEDTSKLQLEHFPITSILSITYTTSSDSDEEDIDDYRSILSKGLIILDSPVYEGYLVKVTYTVGWTPTTIPDLVKVLIAVMAVNHYYSLYPERQLTSNVIVQEKIGDYMVKYSGYVKGTFKSLDEWIEYLINLIKNGEYYTTAE